ncbi:hypothetical protein NPIL_58681 [Nephila pilipes]|uniref:Uncharacterized protein n=1 Tax=Nephila pilipes TaxID=299642 RepID=A0A8X6TZT8_NEPPI|nr:hypothetical protein NPIL_58681 [Nephila pilipes]
MSKLIAEEMKLFTSFNLKVADVVCSERKEFSLINLSARAVRRRNVEMAANIKCDSRGILNNLKYYSISIDESTYLKDVCKLSMIERGITPTTYIMKEFEGLIPVKNTSTRKEEETKTQQIYCIIHQESICTKSEFLGNHSRGLKNREFYKINFLNRFQ